MNVEFMEGPMLLSCLQTPELIFHMLVKAVRQAFKPFVYAWNSCQLYKSQYPDHPAHLMEFVQTLHSPLFTPYL